MKNRNVRGSIALMMAAAVHFYGGRFACADTTVNFGFKWQDWGGTAHPLQSTDVSFVDALVGGPAFAGPIATNATGNLQLVTAYSNVDGANNLEIQPGIIARIAGVGAAYLNNASPNPYTFFPGGNGFYGATLNATTSYNNISFVNSSDAAKTLQVLQLVKFMHDYYGDAGTYNATLPSIRINYNANNTTGSSMGGSVMTLGYTDWGNVDVILHEYGHHVAENNSLEGPLVAKQHSFNQDNISGNNGGRSYGNLNGARLAWQEGIATYLAQVAVNDGNINGAMPGIPADATNGAYDHYTPPNNVTTIQPSHLSFSVAINSLALQVAPFVEPDPEGDFGPPTPGNPPFNSRGFGEGDEMSVMRSLWDFENNSNVENYARAGQTDYSNYGGQRIYNLMKNVTTNKGQFYGFWQAITADVHTNIGKPLVGLAETDPDAEATARLGMTLEQNAISSIPLTTGIQLSNLPTITWNEQNNFDSTKFEVLIYSADWSTLVQTSPQINAGVDSWTLTTPLVGGDYEYVVLNSPVNATAGDLTGSIYNWYWSGDATFSVPEPAAIFVLGLGMSTMLLRRKAKCRRVAD